MRKNLTKDRILIVDDEPMIRLVLCEALREWNYEPFEADTAAAALSKFTELHPVAVLLDINLPDGSGLEVLREFKRRLPNTAVIIITSEVILENTISALRGGADDFLSKPIKIKELHFALQNAIATQTKDNQLPLAQRSRVLIVTDVAERLHYLDSALRAADPEITRATSLAELNQACQQKHDLVVVDLPATQLPQALKLIRASDALSQIPLLVAAERIATDAPIAGLLSKYRAMACSQPEIIALACTRLSATTERRVAHPLL